MGEIEIMSMPAKDEIERLAYFLWEQERRPDGRDVFHYVEAERILKEWPSVQSDGQSSTPSLTDRKRSVIAAVSVQQPAAPASAQARKPAAGLPSGKAPAKGRRKPGSKR